MVNKEITLDDLIEVLERDGLRITSYTSQFKGKAARLAIVDALKELRTSRQFDYFPTA